MVADIIEDTKRRFDFTLTIGRYKDCLWVFHLAGRLRWRLNMDDQWSELIEFVIDKTFISKQRIERILQVYTPEPLPQPLQEVLQDILTGKEVTRDGVSPFTKYGALSSLLDLEGEQTREEILQLEMVSEDESLLDNGIGDVPEFFLEYVDLIEDICSKTGEDEETIHQVHRAYLEYVYMKTNNPETLVPFLRWYLKTEENIKHDLS